MRVVPLAKPGRGSVAWRLKSRDGERGTGRIVTELLVPTATLSRAATHTGGDPREAPSFDGRG
jgi:hypothetical protein